ncbi:hypothetical protein CKO25_18420 [Thiocapsa imhoffii]|uniref:Uncharacterized protein n=1 Tax=Thiocapsa imhoffii TaxID=382777 RepID=A0A9X0WMA5_9GAMM|nr:hypothetical protein [Thiocapsa imhoffii]
MKVHGNYLRTPSERDQARTGESLKIAERPSLARAQAKLEVESLAYLVCKRDRVTAKSESDLADYGDKNTIVGGPERDPEGCRMGRDAVRYRYQNSVRVAEQKGNRRGIGLKRPTGPRSFPVASRRFESC